MGSIQARTVALGYNLVPRDAPMPVIRAGDIWSCRLPDPTRSYAPSRPVLVLGTAEGRPAYSLVPLVHVIPLEPPDRDRFLSHTFKVDGKLLRAAATDITTIPASTFTNVIGHIQGYDHQRVMGHVKTALGIDERLGRTGNALIRKGGVHSLVHAIDGFDTETGMIVVAGCSGFNSNFRPHAMPLTPSPQPGQPELRVGDTIYGVDTRQLKPLPSRALGPRVMQAHPEIIGRLNSVMAARLDLP